MSEFINNVTRRKEIIKQTIRLLHEGKTVEEVKATFGEIAREATSAEIAEVEQMLINEGLPVEEVQRLCDVHVSMFSESLDQQTPPDSTPGHPVHTFLSENKATISLLSELGQLLGQLEVEPNNDDRRLILRSGVQKLMGIHKHYQRKEYLLFPYLEKKGFSGPSKVMWGIHDEIRKNLKELFAMLDTSTPANIYPIKDAFVQIDSSIRSMIYKEENILFPASLERLSIEEWVAIRTQEEEIGFFLYAPVNPLINPVAAGQDEPARPAPVRITEGLLPMQTGMLSIDQINMMLVNLPIDITFVDENDTVRYFSQTRERIFERQPAIIGRAVQNCHPPQSIGRVQQILDDFRSGQRDTAEFWIQMGPRFVHIRYFAMRDAAGDYRGCLEVTQDIAPLRALQGERRLLDEKIPRH